jgi:hypothetical protein
VASVRGPSRCRTFIGCDGGLSGAGLRPPRSGAITLMRDSEGVAERVECALEVIDGVAVIAGFQRRRGQRDCLRLRLGGCGSGLACPLRVRFLLAGAREDAAESKPDKHERKVRFRVLHRGGDSRSPGSVPAAVCA